VLTINDNDVICQSADRMIRTFADRETEIIWQRRVSRRLPRGVQRVALRKPYVLHRAKDLNDLRVPPADRLEELKRRRSGQYSIRINDQWRVCFRWQGTNTFDVEIVDCH